MKKVVVLIFTIIMSLIAVGCSDERSLPSNSFYVEVKITEYGGVSQTIALPSFSKELEKSYSKQAVQNYLSDLQNEIESKLYNAYYIKYWLRYLENPNKHYAIGGEFVEFSSPKYFEEDDRISFSFDFLTNSAWKFYSSSSEDEEGEDSDELVENNNLSFITTIESQAQFPFAQAQEGEKAAGEVYATIVKDTISNHFNDFDLNSLDFVFEYRYLTSYSRLHSNADEFADVDGQMLHRWVLNESELSEGKEIKIWMSEANRGLWYLASLIVVLTLAAVVFAIIFIKNRKKPKLK